MITLEKLLNLVEDLPPETLLGISFDDEIGCDVLAFRSPDSKGGETIVDCGTLDPYEDETES